MGVSEGSLGPRDVGVSGTCRALDGVVFRIRFSGSRTGPSPTVYVTPSTTHSTTGRSSNPYGSSGVRLLSSGGSWAELRSPLFSVEDQGSAVGEGVEGDEADSDFTSSSVGSYSRGTRTPRTTEPRPRSSCSGRRSSEDPSPSSGGRSSVRGV